MHRNELLSRLDETFVQFLTRVSLPSEIDIRSGMREKGWKRSFKIRDLFANSAGKAVGNKNKIDMPHRRRGPFVDKRLLCHTLCPSFLQRWISETLLADIRTTSNGMYRDSKRITRIRYAFFPFIFLFYFFMSQRDENEWWTILSKSCTLSATTTLFLTDNW